MREVLIKMFGLSARSELTRSARELRQTEKPFLKSGVAQVTAVCTKMVHTADLAGARPHASRLAKPKRKDTKDERLNLRLKHAMKERLLLHAKAAGSYPTAFALEILAARLGLPIDDYAVARNQDLKIAFFKNSIAFNRVGNLMNQMQASMNKGVSCPLTREQLSDMTRQFSAACIERQQLKPV